MAQPAQSVCIDAASYADYLGTIPGRLRLDLAWENLRAFLPPGAKGRALDVGCGTGEMAVRLAASGFCVDALDADQGMRAATKRTVAEAGLEARVSVAGSNAEQLSTLFAAASFDVIVCHNLLEFTDRPWEIAQAIELLLARSDEAVASVIVRNRAGEVLSAALKAGDLAMAEDNLTAAKVRGKLADQLMSVFTPAELRATLADARMEVVAEYGIRILTDYLPEQLVNAPAGYSRLLALEQKLGQRPEFAAIARYTQVIARPARNLRAPAGQMR